MQLEFRKRIIVSDSKARSKISKMSKLPGRFGFVLSAPPRANPACTHEGIGRTIDSPHQPPGMGCPSPEAIELKTHVSPGAMAGTGALKVGEAPFSQCLPIRRPLCSGGFHKRSLSFSRSFTPEMLQDGFAASRDIFRRPPGCAGAAGDPQLELYALAGRDHSSASPDRLSRK